MAIENSTYEGGMLVTNYDNRKMFIFQNNYLTGEVNAGGYEDLVIPLGTLLGRVASTGELVPLASGASDGSQYPVGVAATNYTIADGDTATVTYCSGGEIDASMIVFDGSDDLDTVVDGRQLRDHLQMAGFVLRNVTQLGEFDNQ